MNLISLAGSFFFTGLSLFALKPIAIKIGLVDIPGGRKTHLSATPLVGGLGIFVGLFLISLATPGVSAEYGPLLSLAAIVLFIGTVDDAKELTVASRMTGHGLVALAAAIVAGIQLNSFGAILFGVEITLGIFSIPITVFAVVGVINAINMSDGIDGLCGALLVVSLSLIAILSYAAGRENTTLFCLLVISSILAFLTLNFRRPWHKSALVYMGDAGSTMLGFVIAWLLISGSQGEEAAFAPVYALWILAVPLFDTINLLIKRPLRGQSPFAPATDHLHHNLLSRGFSIIQTVSIMSGVAIIFGGVGVIAISFGASEALMFQLFIGLFILYYLFSDRIKAPQA